MPHRPADEDDEAVLASIARQHASRLGLMQVVRQGSPQADWVSPEPPVVSLVEPPVVRPAEPSVVRPVEMPVSSEVKMPLRKPIDVRSSRSPEVFYVRRARQKSLHKSVRDESARRLIIHLAVVAVLTGLAVALYFLTRD